MRLEKKLCVSGFALTFVAFHQAIVRYLTKSNVFPQNTCKWLTKLLQKVLRSLSSNLKVL